MSKGNRLYWERQRGERKPNGVHWNEIQPGMMLMIPSWRQVQAGASPLMLPVPPKNRFKAPRNQKLENYLRQAMRSKHTPSMSR